VSATTSATATTATGSAPGVRPAPRRTRRGLATEAAIVDAAERLIARYGLSGVSLGQIARAANQSNRAAPQYYFASLDELVMAVMRRRMPEIRERADAMLRDLHLTGRSHQLRALAEVHVLPNARILGHSGSYFRFCAQIISPNLEDRFHWLDQPDLDIIREWESCVLAQLGGLAPAVRAQRISMVFDLCASTLATVEAKLERKDPIDITLASTVLVDATVSILTAPDSSTSSGNNGAPPS
jgi:AcrR family transcriptional regulator